MKVLFSQRPKFSSRAHFGCRIVDTGDGHLFLTLGDRFSRMADAQTLDNHHGKVVRIGKDGSVPKDNPFSQRAGALPEIWSLGHRNLQGATLGPDGHLWTLEHGPQGGDELNRPEKGKNYGWPVITYGENYGGGAIGEGLTGKAGLEQPVHHWTPSIAPSGMAFVSSTRYGPDWVGTLAGGFVEVPLPGAPDPAGLKGGAGREAVDRPETACAGCAARAGRIHLSADRRAQWRVAASGTALSIGPV